MWVGVTRIIYEFGYPRYTCLIDQKKMHDEEWMVHIRLKFQLTVETRSSLKEMKI